MSGTDVILAGTPDSPSEEVGEGDALEEPREVEPAHGVKRRRLRRSETPGPGSFTAWLLVDATIPLPKRPGGSDEPAALPARRVVVGFCKVSWAYKTASDASARDTYLSVAPRSVTGGGFGAPAVGYLEYTADAIWRFSEMQPVPDGFDCNSAMAPLKLRRLCSERSFLEGSDDVEHFLANCTPACRAIFFYYVTNKFWPRGC